MEKEVKVTWEGKPAIIVMGEITWKDKKDAIRKSMKKVQHGRSMKKETDPIYQRELMMLSAMKKAPFEINATNIDKLSSKDGERIYIAYTKLNELDDEEGEE